MTMTRVELAQLALQGYDAELDALLLLDPELNRLHAVYSYLADRAYAGIGDEDLERGGYPNPHRTDPEVQAASKAFRNRLREIAAGESS